MDATKRPWVVQKLNHAEGEPCYQIGWLENGNEVGPICELSGGAVRSRLPVWYPVAEFKYLIAEKAEIEANAHLIVTACNNFDEMAQALEAARATLQEVRIHDQGDIGYNLRSSASIMFQIDALLVKIKEG